jgi:hypothetical protein
VSDALRHFGAAIAALDEELDWELLGRAYCEGEGSSFFDADLRERIIDTGLLFADDVASALGSGTGRSLYLGAEIAELPLILAEHLVLRRRVEWLNVDAPHVREIARAIEAVGARLKVELPKPSTRAIASVEPKTCDHLWMASVLTDPDHFPALHDALYERAGTRLATGRGDLDDDRRRADVLVTGLLERAADPCVLTTTDEEWTLVAPLAVQLGFDVELARNGRLTAIVGDLVRIGSLRRTA